jgi:hypothetical protein
MMGNKRIKNKKEQSPKPPVGPEPKGELLGRSVKTRAEAYDYPITRTASDWSRADAANTKARSGSFPALPELPRPVLHDERGQGVEGGDYRSSTGARIVSGRPAKDPGVPQLKTPRGRVLTEQEVSAAPVRKTGTVRPV